MLSDGRGVDPDGKLIFYVFRYLIFMGTSTHDYDYTRRVLITKQWAADLCSVVDCFVLIVCPFYVMYVSKYFRCEIFLTRLPAMMLNCFLLLAEIFAIVFSRFGNRSKREKIKLFFDEINKIRLTEFGFRHHNYNRVRDEMKRIILLRLVCSCFIILALSAVIIYQSQGGLFVDVYWAAGAIFVILLLIAMENQISFGMLYGTYVFKLLNCRLMWIVSEINGLCENNAMHIVNRKTGFLCYELKRIGRVHTTMMKLVIDFKDALKMQLFFNLSSIIISQVYYAFILLVFFNGNYVDEDFQIICASVSVLTGLLNLWLLAYIGGEVIQACNGSAAILGSLSSWNVLNKQLETRIQILSFQFMREKMKLMIFGMFNLDWARGFIITGVTIEYLLILVQFDYYDFNF